MMAWLLYDDHAIHIMYKCTFRLFFFEEFGHHELGRDGVFWAWVEDDCGKLEQIGCLTQSGWRKRLSTTAI